MSESRDPLSNMFPNVFDHSETPLLREAFRLAWPAMAEQGSTEGADEKQKRLANAIVAVASSGVFDPQTLADRALERCAKGLF